jgi:hypothetical protein
MSSSDSDFRPFPKLARMNRSIIITEKIDGTNAQILVTEEGEVFVGSRTRWITPEQDNHGFARWVRENEDELRVGLGPGRHFGEWWGSGIQRGYGLPKGEKRFSLFNVFRWVDQNCVDRLAFGTENAPKICHVVPILFVGSMNTALINKQVEILALGGSAAAPGFKDPEGVVVFHVAANLGFKITIKDDEIPKALIK